MKIQELLPHLKKGWACFDTEESCWLWNETEPSYSKFYDFCFWIYDTNSGPINLNRMFDLEPFYGDWKDSLMKCGEKK